MSPTSHKDRRQANPQSTTNNLRDLFARLFDVSRKQMEAVDRDDFHRLSELLAAKDEILAKLDELRRTDPVAADALREVGADEPCTTAERGTLRALVRKLRSHEKYVMRIIQNKQSAIGERLGRVQHRRNAAAGYRPNTSDGRRLNLSG